MIGSKRPKLVEADFRVCCSRHSTSETCSHMIDAIRGQFDNITRLDAARPHGSAEDMCVIGTAMIRQSMRSRFENDLKKLEIGKVRIKKAIVILPNGRRKP